MRRNKFTIGFALCFFFFAIGLFTYSITTVFADGNGEPDPAYEIENPGFETGDLTGWDILEGDAFHDARVVDWYDTWDGPFHHQGTYHYHGGADEGAGNGDYATGRMRSSDFTVGGSGYISFLLGAAPHTDDIYVRVMEVVDEGDDIERARIVNNKFVDDPDPHYANTYLRRYVDLSEYMGETMYIEVVNNVDGGWGIINLDDFQTYHEDPPALEFDTTPIEATIYQYDPEIRIENEIERRWDEVVDFGSVSLNYRNEHGFEDLQLGFNAENLDMSGVDLETPGTYDVYYEFSYLNEVDGLQYYTEERLALSVEVEEIGNTLPNGNFETGDLGGWTVTDGDAFNDNHITDRTTWWAEEYPFNHEGTYHYAGEDGGVSSTGRMRSAQFVLEGSGYVSMLLGAGRDTERNYVRIMDGETDEEIARVVNEHFSDPDNANNYIRYYVDLSEHVGDRLYFEAVDENDDSADFPYINLDDFVSYYEETPALDVHDTLPENIALNDAMPVYDDYFHYSANYVDPDFEVTETDLATSSEGEYSVTYEVAYQSLSETFTRNISVERPDINVTLTSYFELGEGVETTIEDVAYGSQVGFDEALASQEGYEFAFWVVNNTLRKDLPIDHDFTLRNTMDLEAYFSPEDEHVVVLMDSNGQTLDVQHVEDGEDASDIDNEDIPGKPALSPMSGEDRWDGSLENITEDTVLILQYEQTDTSAATLTVNDGEGSGQYTINTSVTATSDLENFSHWEKDGDVVGFDSEYRFTIVEDTTLTAVGDEEPLEEEPLLLLSDDLELRSDEDLSTYVAQFHLPEGYELIEYGLIASDAENDIHLHDAYYRHEGTKFVGATNEYIMSIPDDQTNVRAYLIYEYDGNLHTIYSESGGE